MTGSGTGSDQNSFDVVIIGAGIAGASLAYRLSGSRRVVVLEAEDQPGQHATGRSAAFFAETYGNEIIRRLTTASRDFYENPPDGFTQTPLLEDTGALHIARDDQRATLEEQYETTRALAPSIEKRGGDFAKKTVPVLDQDVISACIWEPGSKAINVHELLTGYLQGAKKNGAIVLTNAPVKGFERRGENWIVQAGEGEFCAHVVVNAAGAWAGEIGTLAGAVDVGLQPFRRSVCVIDPKKAEGIDGDISNWPLVIDVDEDFYFKPSGGMIWLSPADETPSPPCDAQAEDLDIAIAVDRLQSATSIRVRRVEHKWAGLRSFVPDRTPVVGFDPTLDGFFWLAGQGGYGIQTSPALSEVAAALITNDPQPTSIGAAASLLAALGPARFDD